MPLLLRLLLSLVRAGLAAVAIVLAGWINAVPPDAGERRALGLGPGPVSEPGRDALRTLRLARTAVRVAPDLATDLIVRQGQGSVSRDEVQTALRAMANGSGGADGAETSPDPVTTRTLRRISGAKFVTAPTSDG